MVEILAMTLVLLLLVLVYFIWGKVIYLGLKFETRTSRRRQLIAIPVVLLIVYGGVLAFEAYGGYGFLYWTLTLVSLLVIFQIVRIVYWYRKNSKGNGSGSHRLTGSG